MVEASSRIDDETMIISGHRHWEETFSAWDHQMESENSNMIVTQIVTISDQNEDRVKRILTVAALRCIIQVRKWDPYQRRRQEQWLI